MPEQLNTGSAPSNPNPAVSPAGPESPPNGAGPASPPASPATEGDGDSTLLDGGGDLDGKQTVPANWPANWRDIMAGGDTRALKMLGRYQSPANVWKAYAAIQQKLTAGELLRTKPDGTDPQALNEWRSQIGVPEKPEGYLEKLPKGLVIGEDDQALIGEFVEAMHAADAPPAHVHTALSWYYAAQEKMAEQRAAADRQNRATAEDELRADLGPEYRPTLNAIHGLLDSHGSGKLKEKLFGARLGDGTPFGDDMDVLKFLSAVAREINPHGTVTPAAGETAMQTIDGRIAALEAEMAQAKNPPPGSYWKNEAKQEELRKLYDMRDSHKVRAG